jgi:hypothetical protein
MSTTRPVLILQLRPEDPTADSEYACFLKYGQLQAADTCRIRIEKRGRHPRFVFTYRKHRIARIHNTAWRHARQKAARPYEKVFGRTCPEGFRNIRMHDLKHTFGTQPASRRCIV